MVTAFHRIEASYTVMANALLPPAPRGTLLKRLIIVGDGLRQREKLAQQLFGRLKPDMQRAGTQSHAGRQVRQSLAESLRLHSDSHARTGLQAADGIQPFRQALFSPPLHLEIGTIADLFQLGNQFGPIDQKRPPSLIPAEAAYQVDSAPPAPAKKRRLYHFILSGSSLIHTS